MKERCGKKNASGRCWRWCLNPCLYSSNVSVAKAAFLSAVLRQARPWLGSLSTWCSWRLECSLSRASNKCHLFTLQFFSSDMPSSGSISLHANQTGLLITIFFIIVPLLALRLCAQTLEPNRLNLNSGSSVYKPGHEPGRTCPLKASASSSVKWGSRE